MNSGVTRPAIRAQSAVKHEATRASQATVFDGFPKVIKSARVRNANAQARCVIVTKPIGLACALGEHDHLDRLYQDEEIKEDRAVLYVVKIVRKFLSRVLNRSTVRIIDLRPATYSRPYGMPLLVERNRRGKLLDKEGAFRPGPD